MPTDVAIGAGYIGDQLFASFPGQYRDTVQGPNSQAQPAAQTFVVQTRTDPDHGRPMALMDMPGVGKVMVPADQVQPQRTCFLLPEPCLDGLGRLDDLGKMKHGAQALGQTAGHAAQEAVRALASGALHEAVVLLGRQFEGERVPGVGRVVECEERRLLCLGDALVGVDGRDRLRLRGGRELELGLDQPVGVISDPVQDSILRVEGRVRDPRQFENLVVARKGGLPLTIGDLGVLVEREREPKSQARIDGQRAAQTAVHDLGRAQDAHWLDLTLE